MERPERERLSTSWSQMLRPDVPSIERVVVPMELDEQHEAAARWAATMATSAAARTLFIVPDQFASSERPPYRRDIEAEGTTREALDWLASIGVEPDEVEMVVGDPEDRVDAEVDEHAIVVVGTEEVAGVTPLAIGASARSLASRLDCPVVAVPASSTPSSGPILVATSGRSEDEIRSLAWAVAVGEALDRPVVAVHAFDPMYDTFDNAGDYGEDDRLALDMARRADVAYVRKPGDAVEVCRSEVRELDASLLVVSAKHQRSLGGRLLGRVADALIHEPPAPLAVVTHDYTSHDTSHEAGEA